jgi:hypothetical protein
MLSLHIMHFSGHKSEREFLKYIRDRGEDRTKHILSLKKNTFNTIYFLINFFITSFKPSFILII